MIKNYRLIMKKTYIQPAVEIFDITVNSIMVSISFGGDDKEPPLSNKHRGDWDNIWGE